MLLTMLNLINVTDDVKFDKCYNVKFDKCYWQC